MAMTATRFLIPTEVCSTTDKDGTTVLHITRDKMYSVIGVGSLIWARLAAHEKGLTHAEIAGWLSSKFPELPRSQIECDVSRLLEDFERNGLVHTGGWSDRLGGPATITADALIRIGRRTVNALFRMKLDALAAFVGLGGINFVLKVMGFRFLYAVVKRWPLCGPQPNARGQAQQVCAALDRAATWYPRQALCLQRSAVAACLLRSRGLPAEMVIGCRKIPFKAHAWVEVNGEVVNDKKKVQDTYRVLDRW